MDFEAWGSYQDIVKDNTSLTGDTYSAYQDGGGCEDLSTFGRNPKERVPGNIGGGGRRVHVVETQVMVLVKDINDNPPVFPNATMYGEVQENGPIGEY